jgi:hypothetical protein
VEQHQRFFRELDPARLKQLARLLQREAQVGVSDLGQPTSEAEAMQPESRILAGRENQPQSRGQPSNEQVQPREGLDRIELMEIVNDQDERFVQRIEVDEQPLDYRLTAKDRCRVNTLDQIL